MNTEQRSEPTWDLDVLIEQLERLSTAERNLALLKGASDRAEPESKEEFEQWVKRVDEHLKKISSSPIKSQPSAFQGALSSSSSVHPKAESRSNTIPLSSPLIMLQFLAELKQLKKTYFLIEKGLALAKWPRSIRGIIKS